MLVLQEEWNREELLKVRFTTNAAAASTLDGGEETSILIDRALEHSAALDRSHRGIDDLLSHGGAMLDSLRGQRESLKGIQKKMLDVASTLGQIAALKRLLTEATPLGITNDSPPPSLSGRNVLYCDEAD